MSRDINRESQRSFSSSGKEPAKIQPGQTPSGINLRENNYPTNPLDEEDGTLLVDMETESMPEMDENGKYLYYHNSGRPFTVDEDKSNYSSWRDADNTKSQIRRKEEENNRIQRKGLLGRIRIQREYIKQDTEELVRALDLPSETVYDVLAVSYNQHRATPEGNATSKGIGMHNALQHMDLAELEERCGCEMQKQRRKETFDDQYCLELFRRAIVQRADQAWVILQQRFGETVRGWLRSHHSSDLALKDDSEENYIALTFSRFWYTVREQQIEFPTIYAALSYLHAILNGVIIDSLRTQRRAREVPLSETGAPDEPVSPEREDEDQALWRSLQRLITDAREQRVLDLLYYYGLKPREIVARYPQEFPDVKEVYRLNHNILDRLRRNKDRMRWLLGN